MKHRTYHQLFAALLPLLASVGLHTACSSSLNGASGEVDGGPTGSDDASVIDGGGADGSEAGVAHLGEGGAGCGSCSTPPSAQCVGASLQTHSPTGTCANGTCQYASMMLSCPNGCASGQCTGDPCLGVTCDNPPASTCADANTLTTYAQSGVCDATGRCQYTPGSQTCPNGCSNGQCTGDPCVGVTCSSPPATSCADAMTLTIYASQGTCSGGQCSYTSTSQPCSGGCSNGQCMGDPCLGVTCTTPPANSCADANTLTTYDPLSGQCSSGTCSYTASTTTCANGCSGGKCNGDPCTGVTCNTPPAATCSDANTLVTYAASGQCSTGACSYTSSSQTCPNGCSAGQCTGCTWTSETVATGLSFLADSSMVIDASGNPQIVYVDYQDASSNTALIHASKSNGTWTRVSIASGTTPNGTMLSAYQTGLAADPSGNLHVVYQGMHFVYANGAWNAPDSYCPPQDQCNSAAAIAVDASGVLYVAYYSSNGMGVRYATFANGAWTFETIDPNGPTYAPYNDSIAIGLLPGNVPAVGYINATGISWASRANGTWTVESVQSFSSYARVSMEIDPSSGNVLLAASTRYAQRVNGSWSTTKLGGYLTLPTGFSAPGRLAATSGSNLLMLTQTGGASFTTETIGAAGDGSSVTAAVVQGTGASGTIYVARNGYQNLVLYHRCGL